MKLVKNAAVAEDGWTTVADDENLPEGGAVIVSLARFKAERDTLVGRNAPLGLRLKSNEPPATVAEDLERFSVIALEFPIFRDGRAYSHATQLRQRFGFEGEIRAVGDVLWDQLLNMIRCGIDAFEVDDDFPLDAFDEAPKLFSNYYQPAAVGGPSIFEKRHGA
ncbi:DUF934 domain-containing protein [Zavarzinia sp.]|uniref:DUF934 domain-containing protein n=1 Tax=Zavarzinia sp. TaxID=2027920 RepID=UPI003564C293